MNINLEPQGFELSPSIVECVFEYARKTLNRFDDEIKAVDVHLRHDGAAFNTSAAFNIYLKHRSPVRITTVHEDLYQAISTTATRAEEAVERSLSKRRRLHRSRLRRLQSIAASSSML